MAKFEEARAKFLAALARFEEAVLQEDRSNPLLLDGTIQRFEFTVEMAWRLMKHAAAANGVDTFGPRPALEAAHAMGLIDDDAT
jgi:nucleotidyltransferase substrate binding protein (TIGR01987 family)